MKVHCSLDSNTSSLLYIELYSFGHPLKLNKDVHQLLSKIDFQMSYVFISRIRYEQLHFAHCESLNDSLFD